MLTRNKYLTTPEYSALLSATEPDQPAWMLFFTIGNLGLRIIEAHRIIVSDVLVTDNRVKIHTAKQGENTLDEMDIAPAVMVPLAGWLKDKPADDPVFPWSKRMSQWMFSKYMKRLGLTQKGRGIHSLRHFRGLFLTEAGATPVEVKDQLRHRSITSTNTYLHVTSTRELVNRIGAAR